MKRTISIIIIMGLLCLPAFAQDPSIDPLTNLKNVTDQAFIAIAAVASSDMDPAQKERSIALVKDLCSERIQAIVTLHNADLLRQSEKGKRWYDIALQGFQVGSALFTAYQVSK